MSARFDFTFNRLGREICYEMLKLSGSAYGYHFRKKAELETDEKARQVFKDGGVAYERLINQPRREMAEKDLRTLFLAFAWLVDPTAQENQYRWRYLDWAAKIYLQSARREGTRIPAEDIDQLHEDLLTHRRSPNALPVEARDINRLKSWHDLRKAVYPLQVRKEEKLTARINHMMGRRQRQRIRAQTLFLYEGEAGAIFIPLTRQSAAYHGNATRWCTSSRERKSNYFTRHNIDAPLITYRTIPSPEERQDPASREYRSFKFTHHAQTLWDELNEAIERIPPPLARLINEAERAMPPAILNYYRCAVFLPGMSKDEADIEKPEYWFNFARSQGEVVKEYIHVARMHNVPPEAIKERVQWLIGNKPDYTLLDSAWPEDLPLRRAIGFLDWRALPYLPATERDNLSVVLSAFEHAATNKESLPRIARLYKSSSKVMTVLGDIDGDLLKHADDSLWKNYDFMSYQIRRHGLLALTHLINKKDSPTTEERIFVQQLNANLVRLANDGLIKHANALVFANSKETRQRIFEDGLNTLPREELHAQMACYIHAKQTSARLLRKEIEYVFAPGQPRQSHPNPT